MTPSTWALYVMAVCSVTNLSERFVRYHLSYAKGLQYQVVWWRYFYNPQIGVSCEKMTSTRKVRVVV